MSPLDRLNLAVRPIVRVIPVLLVLVLATACAATANDFVGSANADGIVAGFWRGVWHGVIAPATFVISLFSDHVQMYEVHNNGRWYNFGFLVGMVMHGGTHAARRRRAPRRPDATTS
jgi:hypothetical protein